jgi:hypothetical protein
MANDDATTVNNIIDDSSNMANLLDNVENSVWHAFDVLALDGDGTAPKTKLKVGFRIVGFSICECFQARIAYEVMNNAKTGGKLLFSFLP